jgi:hypothetical protein
VRAAPLPHRWRREARRTPTLNGTPAIDDGATAGCGRRGSDRRAAPPPGARRAHPYFSLTSYDDHIALIYEGKYENFVRKPAKIGPETAYIEISFKVRNQDKSETCTTTWRASGKRFTPKQSEVDAVMRRLSSGRK